MSACPNGMSCPACPHPSPWVPYTNASLRTVTLCEETGRQVRRDGRCPVHGGDACLYVYRHPYDNAIDRWKKQSAWGDDPRLARLDGDDRAWAAASDHMAETGEP